LHHCSAAMSHVLRPAADSFLHQSRHLGSSRLSRQWLVAICLAASGRWSSHSRHFLSFTIRPSYEQYDAIRESQFPLPRVYLVGSHVPPFGLPKQHESGSSSKLLSCDELAPIVYYGRQKRTRVMSHCAPGTLEIQTGRHSIALLMSTSTTSSTGDILSILLMISDCVTMILSSIPGVYLTPLIFRP